MSVFFSGERTRKKTLKNGIVGRYTYHLENTTFSYLTDYS